MTKNVIVWLGIKSFIYLYKNLKNIFGFWSVFYRSKFIFTNVVNVYYDWGVIFNLICRQVMYVYYYKVYKICLF